MLVMEISSVGERVRHFREMRGLDQSVLARRTGLSRAWIYRLEQGAVISPKIGDLEKVAQALGVHVFDLLDPRVPHDVDEAIRALQHYPDLAEDVAILVAALQRATPDERDINMSVIRALVRRLADKQNSPIA